MQVIKKFREWLVLKKKLDMHGHKPPYFKEGEIWWCSIGENIGAEINGKNNYFRRPIVIIRKLDRYSFLALPLTSKLKKGSWYTTVTHHNKISTVIVSQIRHLDYRRLDKRLATLDSKDFQTTLDACIDFLSKNKSSPR